MRRLLLALALLLALSAVLPAAMQVGSLRAEGEETIVIAVEDKDWSPYYLWRDGALEGACAEVAAGAVRYMGFEPRFERSPWVRVLRGIERQTVDAALCATKTEERAAFSHYPKEELLFFDTTLIVRSDSPFEELEAAIQPGKRFGIIKGYSFGGADDFLEDAGMNRIAVRDRDALLKLLIRGRVDAVLDSSLPILYDAERLGLEGQIRALYPPLASTPTFLMFSQIPGHAELAERFSEALKAFKLTPEYAEIRAKYGF